MKKNNKLLDRYFPIWNITRASPVLIPFAGIMMMLLNPSVMAGGFTVGAIACSPINAICKYLEKALHYQINNKYSGSTFLGQGMRPAGAKGTGVFLNCPLENATSWGMPSGHSQIAWYVLGFMIGYFFIWRPYYFTMTHKIVACSLVGIAAIMVSFSRVWVDKVHTFGQIFVGGIIGFLLGLATVLVTRIIAKKYFNEEFNSNEDEPETD